MSYWCKIVLCLAAFFNCFAAVAQSSKLLFSTTYGDFKVVLYDYTPRHKQLILREIRKGAYRQAFFNRIVRDFVVQGGELDDDILDREKKTGRSEGRLAPETDERAFHKIGALGAGRDDNPQKASFFRQIYFVTGKPVTQGYLDTLAFKYNKHFSPERQAYYLQHGGQPRLDGDYTVFGEVYEGLDVLLKISRLATDPRTQKPLKNVKFSVRVL